MCAAPFRLVGHGALCAVQAALARALACWAAQWGIDAAQVDVVAERAWEVIRQPGAPAVGAVAHGWHHKVQAGGRSAWVDFGAGLEADLQQAMFGDGTTPAAPAAPAYLAPAAACAARDALLAALAGAALANPLGYALAHTGGLPVATVRRGGGAVLASVAVAGHRCRVLLDGAAVQALQAAPAALAPLADVDYRACVGQVPVALQLTVGSARVGLGSLLLLAEGDVIALSTRSDAPAALCTMAGHALLAAYLGRCGDSFGAELVQSSHFPENSHA